MVQFAESDHDRSMRTYEENCRNAVASKGSLRQNWHKEIEDNIVNEGMESLIEYEKTLQQRWKRASCLAEFDGVNLGFTIAKKARKRIEDSLNNV